MSERSVITAVTVALIMLGLWLGVDTLTRTTPPQPAPLLNFDPANVDRLETSSDDGRAWVEREDWLGSGRWVIHWGQAGPAQTWPAEDTRVRAALRVLATSTIEPGEPPAQEGATLTLRTTDGSVHTVTFDDRPVGGRIAVRTTSKGVTITGLTDASLFDAFVKTGLLPWRDPSVIGLGSTGPSRVFVEAGNDAIAFARREGRWSLLEPIAVPADPDAAAEFLRVVSSLDADRFVESIDPSDDRTGLAQPLARVEAEFDVRLSTSEGPQSRMVRQSLTVGGATDLSGTSVYALVEWKRIQSTGPTETIVGPVVVALSTEALNKLSVRPEPFIAKASTLLLPASIQEITLATDSRSVRFERLRTAWAIKSETLLPVDTQTLNDLIALLAEKPADRVAVGEPAASDGLHVRLAARGGAGVEELLLISAPDQSGFWTISDRVQRFYSGSTDLLDQARSLLERATSQAQP